MCCDSNLLCCPTVTEVTLFWWCVCRRSHKLRVLMLSLSLSLYSLLLSHTARPFSGSQSQSASLSFSLLPTPPSSSLALSLSGGAGEGGGRLLSRPAHLIKRSSTIVTRGWELDLIFGNWDWKKERKRKRKEGRKEGRKAKTCNTYCIQKLQTSS